MSKRDVFIVFGEEKATLAEVIEVLGTKVKLKDIKAGKVEGVEYKEVEDTDQEPTNEYTEEQLEAAKKALDHVNEVRAEEATLELASTEQDIKPEQGTPVDTAQMAKDILPTHEESIAEGTAPTDTKADAPTDKKDVASMTMEEKMALLAERHAKKVAENPTGDKGNKSKKVVFDGTFPEVGSIKDEKELKKIYKQLTNAQLDEWMALEGLTYTVNANESINRMRKCMAVTALHFPKTPSTKNKSKYADITTEELVEMAINAELDIKDHKGDNRILRMYLIMALRDAGILEAK